MRIKTVISYMLAACAFAWYLLSVSGIDVHTDTHDNRSYVVPLFSGISCEHIHPEDECHCCHIHSHLHSCACGMEVEDCYDNICVVDIPGFSVPQLHCPAACATAIAAFTHFHAPAVSLHRGYCATEACGPPPDILQSFCILRV